MCTEGGAGERRRPGLCAELWQWRAPPSPPPPPPTPAPHSRACASTRMPRRREAHAAGPWRGAIAPPPRQRHRAPARPPRRPRLAAPVRQTRRRAATSARPRRTRRPRGPNQPREGRPARRVGGAARHGRGRPAAGAAGGSGRWRERWGQRRRELGLVAGRGGDASTVHRAPEVGGDATMGGETQSGAERNSGKGARAGNEGWQRTGVSKRTGRGRRRVRGMTDRRRRARMRWGKWVGGVWRWEGGEGGGRPAPQRCPREGRTYVRPSGRQNVGDVYADGGRPHGARFGTRRGKPHPQRTPPVAAPRPQGARRAGRARARAVGGEGGAGGPRQRVAAPPCATLSLQIRP